MARAAAGLNPRQAALLLRCQQVREARLQSEAARCTARHAASSDRARAAQAAAAGHAAEAAEALRRGYDGLIGRGSSLSAIDAIRAREAAAQGRQAQMANAATTAQDGAMRAAALQAEARQHLAEAARNVARCERLLDAASRGWARSRAARDETRSEDGYAALHAWRR